MLSSFFLSVAEHELHQYGIEAEPEFDAAPLQTALATDITDN
jgi:hypothetical protein